MRRRWRVCHSLSAALARQQTHFSSRRMHLQLQVGISFQRYDSTLKKAFNAESWPPSVSAAVLALNNRLCRAKGVYLDETPPSPLFLLLYLGPLDWMSWLAFWQGLFLVVNERGQERGKSFWGQEQQTKKSGRNSNKSVRVRARKRARTAINENASTICIRCQTALEHILLFNEKGGDEKGNSSDLKRKQKKTPQMWWRRRTWGRKRRARLGNFHFALFSTASSSSFYCLKERRSELKHFPDKQAPELVITEAFLYGWLWLWSASLWECRALPYSVRVVAKTGWLLSPTPTVAIRSVKVRRLKMRRGDWFCRFAANGLYVMSPEPDELAPLRR